MRWIYLAVSLVFCAPCYATAQTPTPKPNLSQLTSTVGYHYDWILNVEPLAWLKGIRC